MFSKPVALSLLAIACVAAAGGGAYLATMQHQQAAPATASAQAAPATAAPVAAQDGPTAGQAQPVAVEPAPEPAARAASAERREAAPLRQSARAERTPARTARRSAAPAPAVAAAAPAPAAAAEAAPPPAQPAQAASGAPAPLVPIVIDPAGGAARPAADAAPKPPEKEWQEVEVPADSVLGLQLETSINSEFAKVEDNVDARVTREIRVGRVVAIPAGTRAVGNVVLVEKGGKIKARSRIGLKFSTLILPDSTRLSINTETIYREGESVGKTAAAKIGGATVGGAILGAILGGGKGAAIGTGIGAAGGTGLAEAGDRKPVSLPAGTQLSVRIQSPINMTVEK